MLGRVPRVVGAVGDVDRQAAQELGLRHVPRLEERDVTQHDLIGVAVKLVPLSRTMKEQISKIRGWAFERAIRASPHKQDR